MDSLLIHFIMEVQMYERGLVRLAPAWFHYLDTTWQPDIQLEPYYRDSIKIWGN